MKTNQQLPDSKHFRLQQLAEGVYAAIHIDGGAAISNAGIVDLGDRTLIYDTFLAPQAAEDLRIAAEALTGRSIDAVLNSHWHNDHIWGNQAFSAKTEIISTEETRRLFIATRGHGAYDEFMADAEANLEATRAQFEATEDESQRRQLALWVDYHQSVVETKPILQIRAPNLTFVERLAFHGTGRTAEVIDFVGGHTESDAVFFLPQEGIAFMSDLLFIGHHPYLGGGDPERLLHILEAISDLAPKLLVPGHGPVGAADSLAQMGQYVHTLDDLARKMVEDGEPEEIIDAMIIPEPYDTWLFSSFFPGNMHFLYQRRLGEQGGAEARPLGHCSGMQTQKGILMNRDFIGRCGAFCGACAWRERTNCPGCQLCKGNMFWGECAVAKCSIEKGIEHCGFCSNLACDILQAAFDHPEHGDNGERLANLEAWARGEDSYIELGTFPAQNGR